MTSLTTMPLFSLLSNPAENKDYQKKLEDAYVEFIEETIHLSQVEDDILSVIRNLEFTRIEFIILRTFQLYGKGGNAIKILEKSILFLDAELKILYAQLNTLKERPSTKNKEYILDWDIIPRFPLHSDSVPLPMSGDNYL